MDVKSWKSRPVPQLPGSVQSIRLQDTRTAAPATLPVGSPVGMYVCGITPYDATHMGHAATYVAFDLLNRLWRDSGATVTYVQNVTDVDDPLLERATRDGIDWRDLAADQTALLHRDMEALNVLGPEYYVGAVESIGSIVLEVERLVAADLAYTAPGDDANPAGDVYFDAVAASSASHGVDGPWWLGQISGLDAKAMLPLFAERGGDPDRSGKRHALDPLLWRRERDGEPSWPGGSLGAGRPGWHIECTVIAQRFLPAPFTVQGGGSDLIFPHHEMGAGHAFALSGRELARHYAHTGMVGLDGEKMSKSKGNLVLVSRLREAGVDPAAIRLAILANHYRADWFWTDELLTAATRRLKTWRDAVELAPAGSAAGLVTDLREALAEDLDAPRALAAVDRWATTADGSAATSARDAALAGDAIEALLGVLL